MKRKSISSLFVSGAFLFVGLVAPGFATPIAHTITLDENGNGFDNGTPLLFNAHGTNPLPPAQSPVLVYTLPFSGVSGHVELTEPESGTPGDVLQFLGNGTVIFYSNEPGSNSLAERFSPSIFPFPVTNTVTITETGSPGNDGAFYTPTASQPGFDSSGVTYHFISDSPAVPEPASAALLLLGGVAALTVRKLRIR